MTMSKEEMLKKITELDFFIIDIHLSNNSAVSVSISFNIGYILTEY